MPVEGRTRMQKHDEEDGRVVGARKKTMVGRRPRLHLSRPSRAGVTGGGYRNEYGYEYEFAGFDIRPESKKQQQHPRRCGYKSLAQRRAASVCEMCVNCELPIRARKSRGKTREVVLKQCWSGKLKLPWPAKIPVAAQRLPRQPSLISYRLLVVAVPSGCYRPAFPVDL